MIGPLWGEVGLFRVDPRLRGMKFFLNLGQKFFFFKSSLTPLYFLKTVFPKLNPLTVTGMALCVDLGPKKSQIILLSLRLSGIEFSLVSD